MRSLVFQRIDPVRRGLGRLPRLDEFLVIRPRPTRKRSLFLPLLGLALVLGFACRCLRLGALIDGVQRR